MNRRRFLMAALPALTARAKARLEDLVLERAVPLNALTHHVQGIAIDGERLWVTSVERASRKGRLYEFSARTGALQRLVEIQDGDRYHPGGIASDEASLWIPVAEYRARSSAWIEKRSKSTLELEHRFAVEDHIGAVAAPPGKLLGANWDAKTIYEWDRDGRLISRTANPGDGRYQDMKWADGRLVAAGLVKGGGVIDWIAPDTFRVERRLTAGRTDRGVFFTNEGMAVAGDQLFLLPEDDHSRLFVFPLR